MINNSFISGNPVKCLSNKYKYVAKTGNFSISEKQVKSCNVLFFNIAVKMSKNLLLILLLFLFACNKSQDIRVEDLRVEYMINPIGVDTHVPRFSWQLVSRERNVNQQACRIIVAETLSDINNEDGAIWDSDKLISGDAVNIEYEGKPLQTNKRYYWRVCIQTDGGEQIWSPAASFHTGILDNSEWSAQWITSDEEVIHDSPLLRKEFNIDKKIKHAFAFISARGFYEFYLNGEKVGDHVLDPAITDYRKTILYSTFDVTKLLRRGNNCAGSMLGNGAWNLRKVDGRYSWGRGGESWGNPSFLMQLMITYEDNSESVIMTDNSWKYSSGPVTFNNLYGGEDYDVRKEIKGWSEAGFDDSGWKSAVIDEKSGGKLKSQLMPPIKVVETLQPVKRTNPSQGVYLFDLGQNIAGWWRVSVSGEQGQTIRVRGSETLNDSLFSKPLEEGDRLSTKFRYHSQTWTDYTMKGAGNEVYEPHFFYTGFRYIEVATADGKSLKEVNAEGRVLRSANEITGKFESSDSLLNEIRDASLWAQMGNMHSYPTDCPHREKGAYNGDGQVIAETSMHEFRIAPFYTKWLNDMRDAQEENGRIPNTSPTLVGGMGGGVAWGSIYILLPWWMYNYYNDIRVLQDHYPTMKNYLSYLNDLAKTDENPDEPYIINDFATYWYSLGEWCAPGQSDGPNHSVVNTFYYYYNSLLMSKIANVLGRKDDSEYFISLSDTIKQKFNKKFFDPETSFYGHDEAYQTYQLLALVGNLVPEDFREKVLKTIVEDIEERDMHLNTGIIGTKYLWPILVQGGYGDMALKVASQTTYPSYGYWLKNDATTLLERWSGKNSHNHQMFGSVVEYFYKYLAGIRSPVEDNTSRGYKKIYIEPNIAAGLESVNATVETVAGTVISRWEKNNSYFNHSVSIPANSSAIVALPFTDSDDVTVWEGDLKIWHNNNFVEGAQGIIHVGKKAEKLEIVIGSGNYDFRVE